jgi:hypothetical protein
MLGEVFEMDQWLESVDGQADELGVQSTIETTS